MFPNYIRIGGRWAANQFARVAGASVLVVVLCLGGGAGCARERDQSAQPQTRSASRDKKDTLRRTEPADPFELGRGKKPTPDTMYSLAKIMAARERHTESMGILRNIIAQYPNYLPAYNALAEAYVQIGKSEDAIEVLQAGLKRAPDDAVLLNNLGMAHFLREEYADALPHFERAAERRPEVPLYRANKAATLGMLGRAREARLEYRQILPATDADENVEILDRARRRPGAKPVAAEPAAAPPTEAAVVQPDQAAAAQQQQQPANSFIGQSQ